MPKTSLLHTSNQCISVTPNCHDLCFSNVCIEYETNAMMSHRVHSVDNILCHHQNSVSNHINELQSISEIKLELKMEERLWIVEKIVFSLAMAWAFSITLYFFWRKMFQSRPWVIHGHIYICMFYALWYNFFYKCLQVNPMGSPNVLQNEIDQ